MVTLRLTGVAHTYGDKKSVDGVDLVVDEGEIVCLLGPSGCGKTTLLRLVAGLEQVQQGTIEVSSEQVAAVGRHQEPEKRDVGMVFQDYALFPHLSVQANVAYGLRALPSEDRRDRVGEVLELVGLRDFGKRYPHSLSGGEQQRVALARAMATRPKVLLLDEPFSGLDAVSRHRVREETRTILRSSGTATLWVTHDGEEAMQLSDRIALMRGGRIVQSGTAEELYEKPVDAFAASFFGEVNLWRQRVVEGVVQTPFGVLKAEGCEEGKEATVVIRHEALTIHREPTEGTIRGRIEESRRILGHRLTTVSIDSGGEPARWQVRHRGQDDLPTGSSVHVSMERGRAFVFEDRELSN